MFEPLTLVSNNTHSGPNGAERWSSDPFAHGNELKDAEHFAQFYEADEFLIQTLKGYVGGGLIAGDAVVVVGTPDHREALEQSLRSMSIDVEDAIATGQYVPLDAAATMATFVVDGYPDAAKFGATIRPLVEQAMRGGRNLRAFGEMVGLLWQQGNYEGALRLEELWNELRAVHKFVLYCAYPIGASSDTSIGPLASVCSQHLHVIPAESYPLRSASSDRNQAIVRLQQQARALEAEIIERKRAEHMLELELEEREFLLAREQTAREQAETANRLKDEFLATVSHELRTPLNAIIGWSHMLRGNRLDQTTAARALETIERNAHSQAQLIEDILDVSRVITGKLRLNIEPVDVASVINAAIDSVQLAADTRRIQLEVTLVPSVRCISGDADRLKQVVWNLLSNAIKFTPEGGRVEVRLERVDSQLRLRISDNGEGIDAKSLPFIFDRFRQADGTITRNHGGLGLGLAIVRHLVELHGGSVHAESAGLGQGSTFVISLPLAAAPGDGVRRQARHIMTVERPPEGDYVPSLEGVKVLLVDDDQDTLQMLSAVLTEQKAQVHTASSVTETLEALRWFEPNVLVSDLAMPNEDGYSLITRIREHEGIDRETLPALALTAYVRVEDRARALTAGFNMFVPKPVQPIEFISAIVNLADPAGNA